MPWSRHWHWRRPWTAYASFSTSSQSTLALVDAISRRRSVPPEVQAFARKVIASATQHGTRARLHTRVRRHDFPFLRQPLPVQLSRPPLVEPLTAREQEVLALVAAGCSNQDIAERLVITLHAVKKHTGNIYGKLGVTSRTQAIVRARDLRLAP